ncbi:MAG TPA: J domain-containing protein [Myxococcota bacterium]|nr:J domain-containing protein [Myxococcota bacterium]
MADAAGGGSRRKNPYEVLGVARDADEDTIRKAYRKLARKHHPDVNPGDKAAEERFKAISEAYATLSNAEKRRAYDEFGDVSLESGFDAEAARRAREAFGQRFGGARAGGGGGSGGEEFAFGDLDDLLGDLFSRRGWAGGAGGARGARAGRAGLRGPDMEAEVALDLREAARGGEHRFTITRPTADGTARTETLTVRIPSGVADGGRIRIPGKGGEGIGGAPAGDLHATIRIRPDPVFRLDGRDLHLELPITVREAVLGAKVEVPTLEGRATLQVPPGTDSGKRLRLRGKGMPNPAGGAPGDLYAVVQIRVPKGLSGDAKSKLEALAKFDPPDPRKGLFR